MSQRILFAVCLVFTFAVTVMILRKLIPFLKSKKMGQHILDIGPRWHRSKEGTPTMGGLSFIIASAAAGLCAFVYLGIRDGFSNHLALLFTLLFAAANGLIGMIGEVPQSAERGAYRSAEVSAPACRIRCIPCRDDGIG